jgi:predicted RecA/RadA family phage recombinase
MAEQAQLSASPGTIQLTATAARASGEVLQTPDGRACVVLGQKPPASGDLFAAAVEGRFKVAKSTSVVFAAGDEVWWDESATVGVYERLGDFLVGSALEDAAAAATTILVDLNVRPQYVIEAGRTGFVFGKTLTAGVPIAADWSGLIELDLDATAEAQMASAISANGVPVGEGAILDAIVNVVANGAGATDINIGLANAGHASDADSITESVFIHIDGASLNILAESDDGTTEVAATDTQIDYVEGTEFQIKIDARTLADVQIYVNGALVLGATVFKLNAATGPLKALCHVEKSSSADNSEVRVRSLKVRKVAAAA